MILSSTSVLLLVITGSICPIPTSAELYCHQGQYLTTDDQKQEMCSPCPQGTFQSQLNHRNIDCAYCTPALEPRFERVLKNCTDRIDAEIGCIDGFYRVSSGPRVHHRGYCFFCSNCTAQGLHEIQPCSGHHDAACCPEPDMQIGSEFMGKYECVSPDKDLETTGRHSRSLLSVILKP